MAYCTFLLDCLAYGILAKKKKKKEEAIYTSANPEWHSQVENQNWKVETMKRTSYTKDVALNVMTWLFLGSSTCHLPYKNANLFMNEILFVSGFYDHGCLWWNVGRYFSIKISKKYGIKIYSFQLLTRTQPSKHEELKKLQASSLPDDDDGDDHLNRNSFIETRSIGLLKFKPYVWHAYGFDRCYSLIFNWYFSAYPNTSVQIFQFPNGVTE